MVSAYGGIPSSLDSLVLDSPNARIPAAASR